MNIYSEQSFPGALAGATRVGGNVPDLAWMRARAKGYWKGGLTVEKKKLPEKATVPVPISATVSRKTGEIRFEYSEDAMDQIRFGKIMNRLNRLAEAFLDAEAKARAEAG